MKKLSLLSILKETMDINRYYHWALLMSEKIAEKGNWQNPQSVDYYSRLGSKFFNDAIDLVKHHHGEDGSIQPSPTQEDIDQAIELLKQQYGKFMK